MNDAKCRICGGDLANDYIAGICFCTHCGDKRPLSEADSAFSEYERMAMQLKAAEETALSGENDLKKTEQAVLAYKNVLTVCSLSKPMAQVEEIKQLCRASLEKCEKRRAYLSAKEHFDKKAYSKAYEELKGLGEYGDAAALLAQCEAELEKERKKRIPYSILIGLILPAILFFALKEGADISLAAAFAISIAAAALNVFLMLRGGVLSNLIEILSLIMLIPLIIYALLAYVFHLSATVAALSAIVLPLIVAVVAAAMAERN